MSRDPTARLERLLRSVRLLAPAGDDAVRERIDRRLDEIVKRRSGWSDEELAEQNRAAARKWAELAALGLTQQQVEDRLAGELGMSGDALRALADDMEREFDRDGGE